MLLDLFIGTHTVYAILRPMNVDEKLVARISRENRGAGFDTIRHVLYWNLIQELVKIVADDDCRVPSIHNLRRQFEDGGVKAVFQKKYSAWGSNTKESDPSDTKEFWKCKSLEHEQSRENEFDSLYDKAMNESAELLSSAALSGMKTVRDKLLAHNELKLQNGSYQFVDIRSFGLKYGDERALLEKATDIFNSFFALISRASFDWDRSKSMMEREAKLFWKE